MLVYISVSDNSIEYTVIAFLINWKLKLQIKSRYS